MCRMDTFSWSDAALGDLEAELDTTAKHITQLEAQLHEVRERHQLLQDTILGIKQLTPSRRNVAPPKEMKSGLTDSQLPIYQPVPGAKTRATSPQQILVYVLKDNGTEMTRDELYNGLKDRNLIPSSWVNPRNAFTTTLGRAVKKGAIKQDGDKYSVEY